MKVVTVILQQTISRVIVDRERIPRKAYSRIEPLVKEFQHWGRIIENFRTEEPGTWLSTTMSIVENLVEKDVRQTDPIKDYLHKHGLRSSNPGVTDWIGDFLLEQLDAELIVAHEDNRLCVVTLPDGVQVYLTITGNQYEMDNFHLPKDTDECKEVQESIQDFFWSGRRHILISGDGDQFGCKDHEFDTARQYRGTALDEIRNLQNFMDNNSRRVIVLQGVPGTGKTTLCANAAELLSDRTIVLSNQMVQQVGRSDWEAIIDMTAPTMVIVDDIDKAATHSLESHLFMFEDTYYHVPITLLTTNDQTKLPEAFRRPGRIDQIIEMPLPTKSIRREMLEDFAKREGLSIEQIPDKKYVLLDHMLQKHPPAYIVELLRRYKALGWDYRVPQNDLVFGPIIHDAIDQIWGK